MTGIENTVRSQRGLFYGWVIVFAAFLAFGFVYGTVIYSFTVFVNPLAQTFNTTPTKILFAYTLTNIGTGILGVYAGRLLMSHAIRIGMIFGLVALAAGFLLLSTITALWQLYLIYGVMVAFGSIIVAPLGASAVVINWFSANRGRALTAATLGTSFGQLVLPRMAAFVIEGWGWQSAYRVFAALVTLIIPVVFLLVVDRPEDKGLQPYGSLGSQPVAVSNDPILTNAQILRRADFWAIGVSYVLTVTVYLALVGVMVPYARSFGVTALEASKLVVTMGLFAILGKLSFATFTDRMGLRNTFWIAVLLNLIACVLLVAVPGYRILFVASALAGASAGGVLPLWPGLIAHRFGRDALPRVMGLMSPMVLIIQGFGAPFATALHFRSAYLVFIVMLTASAFFSRNLNRAARIEAV